MGGVGRTRFNRQIWFFLVLTTVAASVPWLGTFRVPSLAYILLNLFTAVSAFCCFARLYEEEAIALLCTAMYTLSVFRIYTLTAGSAPAEGVVLAVLPWVLCSWHRVCAAEKRGRALGRAGLVTLGAGLMWYLSAFVDVRLQGAADWHQMYLDNIQEKGLSFAHLWFQFWKGGNSIPQAMGDMRDTVSVGIGFVPMLGVCLFGALWFGNHLEQEHWEQNPAKQNPSEQNPPGQADLKRSGSLRSLTKWVFVCAVITMAMSLHVFPWERLQNMSGLLYKLIGAIRFPHRFLGWGTLFAVEIFGYCLWLFRRVQRQVYEAIFGVGVVGLLTGGIYLMNFIAG